MAKGWEDRPVDPTSSGAPRVRESESTQSWQRARAVELVLADAVVVGFSMVLAYYKKRKVCFGQMIQCL